MSNHPTPRRAAAQREPSFEDAKRAKAVGGKPSIMFYEGGLELWTLPSGLKTWRCRVQRQGKRTYVNLGRFPEMKIREATAARAAIKTAPNPAALIRQEKAQAVAGEVCFREMAARWIETRSVKAHWTPGVKAGNEARLRNYVLPAWGDRPIASITMDDVETLIGAIHNGTKQRRGMPQTAVQVKQHISGVLGFAVRRKLIEFDPVKQIAEDLPSRSRGDSQANAHVETIEEARAVLRAIEAPPAKRQNAPSVWTLLAHRLIALTGCRKNEVLGARWDEFDLDAAVWTIPAARMKGKHGQREKHFVALSPQAIEVIEAANAIRRSDFVFAGSTRHNATKAPTDRGNRSSLNHILANALIRHGLTRLDERTETQKPVMVPHGWRHTFSTVMNEEDAAYFRVVDVMLAHSTFRDSADAIGRKGGSEKRYNHAKHRSARHKIACQWADMLLEGNPLTARGLAGLDSAPATNVVPIRRAAA